MKALLGELRWRGVKLSQVDALEFFAGVGDRHTQAYASHVRSLEAWEIDRACEPALRRNLPNATVRIGDSFELAMASERQFRLVVLDNPQGVFRGYCEHFEALGTLPSLLATGLVVFNLNLRPYALAEHCEWAERRRDFYGLVETCDLDETWAQDFYAGLFVRLGYRTEWTFLVPRNDFLAYAVYAVSRR